MKNYSIKRGTKKGFALYHRGTYVGNYSTKREAQAAARKLQGYRDAQARGTRYQRAAKNPGLFGRIFLTR